MKTIRINLPGKEDEVLILLHFPIGYLNEKDSEFGLAHLTEHYLTEILERCYKPIEVDGTTGNENLTLYINLHKSKLDNTGNLVDDILKTIKTAEKEINPKILDNEKKRIEIELEEKYSEIFNEINYAIESQIISKPARLKRQKKDQIKNLDNFSAKDVQKCIKKLLKQKNVAFAGYKGNEENFSKLRQKISNNNYRIDLTTRKKLNFKSSNKILQKARNFVVAFPIHNLYKNISEYYSFEFITEQIYEKFFQNIKEMGIYKAEYQYNFTLQGGYIWYFANSYNKINEQDMLKKFHEATAEVIKDDNLNEKLTTSKNNLIKDLKLEWNNFYDKFDWIVEDVTEKGKIIDLDTAILEIKKIEPQTIKKLIRKTFNEKRQIVLID